MLTAGPVSKMALQQEKAFCVLRFEVSRCLPWPPRSPDLTPCDFFLWGFVKDSVYVPPLPTSIHEIRDRPLQQTCYTGSGMSLITVWMCVVWPRVQILKDCNYQMRNLDTCRRWRCMLCPCKVRNTFFIHFWNRTIRLCMPCIYPWWYSTQDPVTVQKNTINPTFKFPEPSYPHVTNTVRTIFTSEKNHYLKFLNSNSNKSLASRFSSKQTSHLQQTW
jgi:hypothetical protein